MPTLKPGVVTGEDYLTLLKAAKDGDYAFPAVNVVNTDSTNAVLEAAAQAGSDVIIQLSNGGAQFFAGQGHEGRRQGQGRSARCRPLSHVAPDRQGVRHLCGAPHRSREQASSCRGSTQLLDHGEKHYASATVKPAVLAHTCSICQKIPIDVQPRNLSAKYPRAHGQDRHGPRDRARRDRRRRRWRWAMSIDDGADNSKALHPATKTCCRPTTSSSPIGHFTVAASFGNVHGVYKPGNVKLRPEILSNEPGARDHENAQDSRTRTPSTLVFHGGSGSEKDKIEGCGFSYGVFKMNIDTDTQFAFAKPVGEYVNANQAAFAHQIDPESGAPYKKVYDPRAWLRKGQQGLISRLQTSFEVLGSQGRSLAQN